MKICVVGLGLMGGSISLALKRAGRQVYGYDSSAKVLQYALANKIIDGMIDGAAEDFSDCDVVFVALPPQATLDFILKTRFKEDGVVCDICGVKKFIEDGVYSRRKDVKYIGAHPMAGKEVSGVENACANLFDNANMVVTRGIYTDERAFSLIKTLTKEMGFARIVECSAEVHDRKIAYTSQLAHVVSNSYVKDGEISACLGFTGGSFQDMTRIAGVDENVWAALYLLNADNLADKCDNLIVSLSAFSKALKSAKESGDVCALSDFLSVGARAYRAGKAEEFFGEGIKITELKSGKE